MNTQSIGYEVPRSSFEIYDYIDYDYDNAPPEPPKVETIPARPSSYNYSYFPQHLHWMRVIIEKLNRQLRARSTAIYLQKHQRPFIVSFVVTIILLIVVVAVITIVIVGKKSGSKEFQLFSQKEAETSFRTMPLTLSSSRTELLSSSEVTSAQECANLCGADRQCKSAVLLPVIGGAYSCLLSTRELTCNASLPSGSATTTYTTSIMLVCIATGSGQGSATTTPPSVIQSSPVTAAKAPAGVPTAVSGSSLTCSCSSVVGGQTMTDQNRAEQKAATVEFLGPIVAFTNSSCMNGATTCAAQAGSGGLQPFCLAYNGPNNPPTDYTTIIWRDCFAIDVSQLPSNWCLNLASFGLPQANRCSCNTSSNCNAALTATSPGPVIPGRATGSPSSQGGAETSFRTTPHTSAIKPETYSSYEVTNAQECANLCSADSQCKSAGLQPVAGGGYTCLLTTTQIPCDASLPSASARTTYTSPVMLVCIV